MCQKKVYFDILNDIVDKCNTTYHRTIKMKPLDVISDSYRKYNVDSYGIYPKSEVGDHVRTSKHKNIFAKGYVRNWSEEDFVISKIKKEQLHGLMSLVI